MLNSRKSILTMFDLKNSSPRNIKSARVSFDGGGVPLFLDMPVINKTSIDFSNLETTRT